jgi:hypothetical protein
MRPTAKIAEVFLKEIKLDEAWGTTLVSFVRSVGVLIAAGILLPLWAAAAEPDVLISTTGEKLIGELESATAATVTFKSEVAGEITVAWSKIKELHSTRRFAVIPKKVKISNTEEAKTIPEGTVSVAEKRIEITPRPGAAARTVSLADSGHVVDEKSFQRAFKSPGLFGGWGGSISAGTSLIVATQNSTTVDGDLTLERVVPGLDWRSPSNRTAIDLSAEYSRSHSTLPTNPSKVKTFVYQADAERDQYLVPRLFGFGQMIYNHDYSQNLSLAQGYLGGLGWTIWKTPTQELDLKGSVGYVQRIYYTSAFNKRLIASTFGESYRSKRRHGVQFHEYLSFIPAWNNSEAYAAAGNAGLTIPISGTFSLDLDSRDSYLHGVPTGYKKNSFQFTVDLSYTLPGPR